MSDTLLTLRDVHINFPARKNWLGKTTEHVHAINGIDLQIRRGETLGIVGESGCGKSTLAQLLMGMLQPRHGQYIRSGSQRIMQMVFQDPLSSLNPRLPVWRIITEPLWIAKRSSEQQRRALAEELAVQVVFVRSISTACLMRSPAGSGNVSPLPEHSLRSLT